jgi:hypothetical protein
MMRVQSNGAKPASVNLGRYFLYVVLAEVWGRKGKRSRVVYMYPKNRSWLAGTNDCHEVTFGTHRFNGCHEISGPIIIGL